MQNVELLLSAKRCETFTAAGIARDVLAADMMAWNALEGVLGADHVGAWALKAMEHKYAVIGENPCVEFKADFVRNPEYEGDPA